MAQQVHVRRDSLGQTSMADQKMGELADGSVRLEIESFSVTSNNITYAVVGEQVGYWNFFPAPEGFGIVPMWGHAKVIESKCPDIAVGERLYGYLPMGTLLDVQPGKISASGFTDLTDYRQPMSPIYNQYSRLSADPEHDPAREDERMIFGPLFKTGFLIEYFMRGENWFGAEQVILTSASSKTALGLAAVSKQRSPGVKRIGLTSSGNVDFVTGTGLYDQVLTYDEVSAIPTTPSISVDFAGNAGLRKAIHEHLTDALKYSCLVGVTHIEDLGEGLGADQDLPGPPPAMFFAPDHAVALFKQHGPEEAGAMLGESWHYFLNAVGDTVEIERHSGLEAARNIYLEMIGGKVDPTKGIVVAP